MCAPSNGQEVREALLQQVKSDNQEIAAMERHITELQTEIASVHGELDDDEEENTPENEEKRAK
jgi:hypothetical protein